MSTSGAPKLKDEGTKTQVLIAGAVAGLVSRFVIAPLDVVKIRLQLQRHPPLSPKTPSTTPPTPLLYRGTLPTLLHILRHEGLPALWKGNTPAELLYLTYAAAQFTTYRHATLALPPSLPTPLTALLAGAAAGALATSATYPLDLLRTRLAAQGAVRVYPTLRAAIRAIAREEGARGFFRGLDAALIQIAPYMGIFFAAYEGLRPVLSGGAGGGGWGSGDAAAGVAASVLAKTAVFPLDLVRKRLQVQGPTRGGYAGGGVDAYAGVWGSVRRIVGREGWRGLYRGLTVSLVKAAPASAVTMWTYERVLGELVAWEKEKERGEGEP